MPRRRCHLPLALLLLLIGGNVGRAEEVHFSRDVLSILSDRCFQCHGPDEADRQAGLRLDREEAVMEDRGGYSTVVPGKPKESELMVRITTDDPDLRMPPENAQRKELSEQEIATLQQWIAAGAEWGRHWSFEPPTRPEIPDPTAHPIDAFVQSRLERKGLQMAPAASKRTLIRRLSFDLIGLPPTPDEVEAFVADDSPEAFDRVVERLLTSPHYGERMAMWWLDAARYADTDGYQGDATRSNWPWRDWVIQAFNQNMPFDQFTLEQFAGDLMPEATPEQILATCFHRNHMTNGEGGRDPEESRIDYVIDRVNTTGTVWLGLTLGCSQCHSHKFDPISQQDYYSFSAFFNSIDEDGKAGQGAKPYLKYKSPFADRAVREAEQIVEARKPREATARQQAEKAFEPWLAEQVERVKESFASWHALQPSLLESVEGTILTAEPDGTIQTSGPHPRQDDYRVVASTGLERVTGVQLEVFPHPTHTDGKLARGASGEFILTNVKLQVRRRGQSQVKDIEIATAIADAEKDVAGRNYGQVKDTLDDDPRNGWTTESHDPHAPHVAVFALAEPLELEEDEELVFVMLQRSTRGDANIGRFRLSVTDQAGTAVRSLEPMPLEQLAKANVSTPAEVDGSLRQRLLDQFLTDHAHYQQAKAELDLANRQLSEAERAAGEQSVMVLKERDEPRNTHVLERGVWDQKGQEVARAVPAAILPWPAEETQTRLDLAKWLVSRNNPLTARVVVNQLWQLCFGAGLVRTPEDFGLQGELPTHPKLLDWLAVELMENDWDLQHVLRLIVTSETYRQSSAISDELLRRDPENRLFARGARYRLPSWMIRDAALRSSGLLNPAIGGPPVMPYQPQGVWEEMFMGRFTYEPSQGAAQHRRTIYAFWRRSAAPTFLFDSSQRRVCEVRPRRTNTPLQALTLLNDQTLLEASRELARSAVSSGDEPAGRLQTITRSILSRSLTDAEQEVLLRELARAVQHYQTHPKDAEQLLNFGQPETRGTDRPEEVAAYLIIASMIFNLDEAITHE